MDLLTAEEWTALTLSLRIAFWATAASLVPGILMALVLARGRFPGHGLLNALQAGIGQTQLRQVALAAI